MYEKTNSDSIEVTNGKRDAHPAAMVGEGWTIDWVMLEMVDELRLPVVTTVLDELLVACTLGALAALTSRLQRTLARWARQRGLQTQKKDEWTQC